MKMHPIKQVITFPYPEGRFDIKMFYQYRNPSVEKYGSKNTVYVQRGFQTW